MPGEIEVIPTVIGAAKAAVGGERYRKSRYKVLVSCLDGNSEGLYSLSGVVNCHVGLTMQWETRIRYIGSSDDRRITGITTKTQHGTTLLSQEGRMFHIEIWQRISWWRRLWPRGLRFFQQDRAHQVLLVGTNLPLYGLFATSVIVVPDTRSWLRGFYVQSVLLDYHGPDDLERGRQAGNFRDDEGLLEHPSVWAWYKRRTLRREDVTTGNEKPI